MKPEVLLPSTSSLLILAVVFQRIHCSIAWLCFILYLACDMGVYFMGRTLENMMKLMPVEIKDNASMISMNIMKMVGTIPFNEEYRDEHCFLLLVSR